MAQFTLQELRDLRESVKIARRIVLEMYDTLADSADDEPDLSGVRIDLLTVADHLRDVLVMTGGDE